MCTYSGAHPCASPFPHPHTIFHPPPPQPPSEETFLDKILLKSAPSYKKFTKLIFFPPVKMVPSEKIPSCFYLWFTFAQFTPNYMAKTSPIEMMLYLPQFVCPLWLWQLINNWFLFCTVFYATEAALISVGRPNCLLKRHAAHCLAAQHGSEWDSISSRLKRQVKPSYCPGYAVGDFLPPSQ